MTDVEISTKTERMKSSARVKNSEFFIFEDLNSASLQKVWQYLELLLEVAEVEAALVYTEQHTTRLRGLRHVGADHFPHKGKVKAQSTFICKYRAVPRVFQNIDPPTPLSTQRVCPPPPPSKGEGYTHSPGGERGRGVNILEDARHRIGLLQYNLSKGKGQGGYKGAVTGKKS
jgi:hypothetical protein